MVKIEEYLKEHKTDALKLDAMLVRALPYVKAFQKHYSSP